MSQKNQKKWIIGSILISTILYFEISKITIYCFLLSLHTRITAAFHGFKFWILLPEDRSEGWKGGSQPVSDFTLETWFAYSSSWREFGWPKFSGCAAYILRFMVLEAARFPCIWLSCVKGELDALLVNFNLFRFKIFWHWCKFIVTLLFSSNVGYSNYI